MGLSPKRKWDRNVSNKITSPAMAVMRERDKIYIKPSVFTPLLKKMGLDPSWIYREPSAGDGKMCESMEALGLRYIATDKYPDGDRYKIEKQDFLDPNFIIERDGKTGTVMGPPFGVDNYLAIKFFNKSAGYSEVIVCIMPASISRPRFYNQLDRNWKQEGEDIHLPYNSFTLGGRAYNVPCVLQKWVRSSTPRALKVEENKSSRYVRFCKPAEANFVMVRRGGSLGKTLTQKEIRLIGRGGYVHRSVLYAYIEPTKRARIIAALKSKTMRAEMRKRARASLACLYIHNNAFVDIVDKIATKLKKGAEDIG